MRALRVALLLCAIAARAFALDVPPQPTNWFTDAAGVVNGDDTAALNAKLQSIEKQSGVRFMVYVFPTLGEEALEDYTIRCAEQWKVWRSRRDDKGLLLTVFVKEHKIRLEVSYPLEPDITDAFSSDIIRNKLAPRFRQNDYAGGLNDAIDAIGAKLGVHPAATAPQPQRSPEPEPVRDTGGFDIGWLIALGFIFFFFILPLLTRRRSGCGGCFWPMFFLGGGGSGITFGGGGGGGWSGGGGGGFSGGGFGGGGSFGGGGASGGW